MKQLVQQLKTGKMEILDVPEPLLRPGMVLVRNRYSVISGGTEGSTVGAARKSLIGKARERPQQVRQAIDVMVQQGLVAAYRAVMKKLESYSPLGYSCAGVVMGVASNVTSFSVGDMVACGGNSASHAEVVAVPVNLCVNISRLMERLGIQVDGETSGRVDGGKTSSNSSTRQLVNSSTIVFKRAAYNTLGAIALQGIRQAKVNLGERVAVIGLGLIGQLTGIMLRAAGVRVVGIDLNPYAVETARGRAAENAFPRSEEGIEEKISAWTSGLGCDAVIVCAATESLDPVNFAGRIARQRARVVIVGNVPTGFDRDPDYYRKELELVMSCSYGPGRYDPAYEEKGVDYPAGYVRWTEKRNMEAFQDLVHSGKIDIDYLTTHLFKLDDAPKAYDMILAKEEPYLGILIEYDAKPREGGVTRGAGDEEREKGEGETMGRTLSESPSRPVTASVPDMRGQVDEGTRGQWDEGKSSVTSSLGNPVSSSIPVIAFIGAGSYAQGSLLPNLPRGVIRQAIMASSGVSSRSTSERFRFEACTADEKDIFENPRINTVFIATCHDSHAEYVLKALKAGKHVFVEKPLCLNESELSEISSLITHHASRIMDMVSPILMVGFNRRFSPLARLMKEKMGSGPMAMLYRVNAGSIPKESWIQDRERGGGRVVGEVCHYVDFLTFLCGALPQQVFARALPDADAAGGRDTLAVTITFADGSVGTIAYFANGSRSLFKEYVEVYGHGTAAVLRDYQSLEFFGKGKRMKKRLWSQDKGQKAMLETFIDAVNGKSPAPIPFAEVAAVTRCTFAIERSMREGVEVRI